MCSDSTRIAPCLPPASSIRANTKKSSIVDTRPAAPDGNAGGFAHSPPTSS
jgi:hypothetical protein